MAHKKASHIMAGAIAEASPTIMTGEALDAEYGLRERISAGLDAAADWVYSHRIGRIVGGALAAGGLVSAIGTLPAAESAAAETASMQTQTLPSHQTSYSGIPVTNGEWKITVTNKFTGLRPGETFTATMTPDQSPGIVGTSKGVVNSQGVAKVAITATETQVGTGELVLRHRRANGSKVIIARGSDKWDETNAMNVTKVNANWGCPTNVYPTALYGKNLQYATWVSFGGAKATHLQKFKDINGNTILSVDSPKYPRYGWVLVVVHSGLAKSAIENSGHFHYTTTC